MAEFAWSYERAAMRGEEMPDNLDMVDQLNFLCLRQLYAQKRAGVIDRPTGAREKEKLGYQRDLWARRFQLREKVVQRSVNMLKDTERAANAYAKQRSLEHADAMYRALYGTEVVRK